MQLASCDLAFVAAIAVATIYVAVRTPPFTAVATVRLATAASAATATKWVTLSVTSLARFTTTT